MPPGRRLDAAAPAGGNAADLSGLLAGPVSPVGSPQKISMKKYFYIAAFMFLGLLVSMLVHAAVEIPTLMLITADPDLLVSSYIWQHWWFFHGVGGRVLSLGFVILGFALGQKFWQILYVEKRYGTPRW